MENEGYSTVFFKFFEEKLGIPGNRGYIAFIYREGPMWGLSLSIPFNLQELY